MIDDPNPMSLFAIGFIMQDTTNPDVVKLCMSIQHNTRGAALQVATVKAVEKFPDMKVRSTLVVDIVAEAKTIGREAMDYRKYCRWIKGLFGVTT